MPSRVPPASPVRPSRRRLPPRHLPRRAPSGLSPRSRARSGGFVRSPPSHHPLKSWGAPVSLQHRLPPPATPSSPRSPSTLRSASSPPARAAPRATRCSPHSAEGTSRGTSTRAPLASRWGRCRRSMESTTARTRARASREEGTPNHNQPRHTRPRRCPGAAGREAAVAGSPVLADCRRLPLDGSGY